MVSLQKKTKMFNRRRSSAGRSKLKRHTLIPSKYSMAHIIWSMFLGQIPRSSVLHNAISHSILGLREDISSRLQNQFESSLQMRQASTAVAVKSYTCQNSCTSMRKVLPKTHKYCLKLNLVLFKYTY